MVCTKLYHDILLLKLLGPVLIMENWKAWDSKSNLNLYLNRAGLLLRSLGTPGVPSFHLSDLRAVMHYITVRLL